MSFTVFVDKLDQKGPKGTNSQKFESFFVNCSSNFKEFCVGKILILGVSQEDYILIY